MKQRDEIVMASSLGIVLVVCIATGLVIGYFLDQLFHSRPWCLIIFLLLGIAAGFWQIIKEIVRLNAAQSRKQSS